MFQRPDAIASHFFRESTIEHFWIKRVFSGEDLSVQEAYELGSLLFSESFDQQAKAMIATYLRMKHACLGEYEGILKALDECYHRHSKAKTDGNYDRKERILWQISEPFDGLDRNFLLTPLLGQLIKKRGHEAIYLGGPSSWALSLELISLQSSMTRFLKDSNWVVFLILNLFFPDLKSGGTFAV
ncbi:MAG: hypothetical protein IPK68_11750 [Bdellovibrionales bacterium]|nr:hypothetical protein [Bdellovibrionales bacterium]